MNKAISDVVQCILDSPEYQDCLRIKKLMEENDGDMYLYPLLAYHGMKNGIYVYNTGQPFVVTQKF